MFKLKSYKKSLKKLLGNYQLPSFPAVTMRILERIRQEDAPISSVVEALALDPGLSVRVLATVNSAAYSPRQRVADLSQAVAMLGMANLESLVLAIAVKGALPRTACTGFEPRRFWLAAVRRAATSQSLAGLLHPASRTACFTAALLQDMAVPLLATCQTAAYGPVLERWHAGEGQLPDMERVALGVDHAEVATWLCTEWSLPESLRVAVGGHHEPPESVAGCLPALSLVSQLREGDDGVDELSALANEQYGLPSDQVVEIVSSSFESAEGLGHFFE